MVSKLPVYNCKRRWVEEVETEPYYFLFSGLYKNMKYLLSLLGSSSSATSVLPSATPANSRYHTSDTWHWQEKWSGYSSRRLVPTQHHTLHCLEKRKSLHQKWHFKKLNPWKKKKIYYYSSSHTKMLIWLQNEWKLNATVSPPRFKETFYAVELIC